MLTFVYGSQYQLQDEKLESSKFQVTSWCKSINSWRQSQECICSISSENFAECTCGTEYRWTHSREVKEYWNYTCRLLPPPPNQYTFVQAGCNNSMSLTCITSGLDYTTACHLQQLKIIFCLSLWPAWWSVLKASKNGQMR